MNPRMDLSLVHGQSCYRLAFLHSIADTNHNFKYKVWQVSRSSMHVGKHYGNAIPSHRGMGTSPSLRKVKVVLGLPGVWTISSICQPQRQKEFRYDWTGAKPSDLGNTVTFLAPIFKAKPSLADIVSSALICPNTPILSNKLFHWKQPHVFNNQLWGFKQM